MTCCATTGCTDPSCGPCTASKRFPQPVPCPQRVGQKPCRFVANHKGPCQVVK